MSFLICRFFSFFQKTFFQTALLLAVVAALAGPRLAAAQEASEEAEALLDRLQARYEAAEAVRAEITQTKRSPFAEAPQSLSGTLLLSGKRYRIETPQQTVVTDGETVWIYNPGEEQVLVNDYVEDEATLAPQDLFTGYRERFRVEGMRTETLGGQAYHVLRLTPAQEGAPLREVTLWLRPSDGLPARVETLDANGARTTFRLDALSFDPPLAPDAFVLDPPAGAEVVDLRDET